MALVKKENLNGMAADSWMLATQALKERRPTRQRAEQPTSTREADARIVADHAPVRKIELF